jgi:two-component system, OmpR family, response regulator
VSPAICLVVIDDDPILRESLAEGLPMIGAFEVYQATDAIDGLHVVAAHRPDCVIVDVRMPQLDGYQFVRAMRGDADTAEIPLIILSALSEDVDRLAGFLSGADTYLNKPVTLETLVATIHEVMKISREERYKRSLNFGEEDNAS